MKLSTLALVAGATLAMARHAHHHHAKRDVVTETNYHYYTVTVGAEPEPEPTTQAEVYPTAVQNLNPEPAVTLQAAHTVTWFHTYWETSSPKEKEKPSPVQEAPATYATAAAPPGGPDDMPAVAINQHNQHRANHSAGEMHWDAKIAGYAANTAATCKFAHDMNQGDGGYGQNLAMWASSDGAHDMGEAGAMKMATTGFWYNGEYSKYLDSFYGKATPDMSDFEGWGHFSQLLWADSKALGCHVQFCAKGTMYSDMDAWYSVCNYSPPGNVGGAYGKNVLKPVGKAMISV